jgi:hypothetical protein
MHCPLNANIQQLRAHSNFDLSPHRYTGGTATSGGESPLAFLLDDVVCTGSEWSPLDCTHLPVGSHNCLNGEMYRVACTGSPSLPPTSPPTRPPTTPPTRPPTAPPTRPPTTPPTRPPTAPPTRSPTRSPTRTPTRPPTRPPTVAPNAPTRAPTAAPTTTPLNGAVRLDLSTTSANGFSVVEIYISGRGWGAICDDLWNLEGTVNTGRTVNADNFAAVVCGQLGYELFLLDNVSAHVCLYRYSALTTKPYGADFY